jgi:hypothetical protein
VTTTGTNRTWIGPWHRLDNPGPAKKSGASGCPMRRVHVCELRNDATAGAGWDFQIFDGPELLVSRRCDSEQHARRVAELAKGDYLRQECVAIEKGDYAYDKVVAACDLPVSVSFTRAEQRRISGSCCLLTSNNRASSSAESHSEAKTVDAGIRAAHNRRLIKKRSRVDGRETPVSLTPSRSRGPRGRPGAAGPPCPQTEPSSDWRSKRGNRPQCSLRNLSRRAHGESGVEEVHG